MHFEILVEDQSGKKALDTLVPKIIGKRDTFRVISYRGIGRIPKGLKPRSDATRRILLDRLPRLLRGYGKTFANYSDDYSAVVIIVCDLDNQCLKTFRAELYGILNQCNPRPETRFCFAIEEGEAWFLGDIPAVKAAYPKAKEAVLNGYVNDSICGTWEKLADAVYPGGVSKLSAEGWQSVGKQKSVWAGKITPFLDVDDNQSPSFHYFRSQLVALTGVEN